MIPITVLIDSHNCLQWFPQLSSFAEILPLRHSSWGLPTSCRLTTAPSPSPWPRIIWKCRVKPAATEAIIEPLSVTPAILWLPKLWSCVLYFAMKQNCTVADSSRQLDRTGGFVTVTFNISANWRDGDPRRTERGRTMSRRRKSWIWWLVTGSLACHWIWGSIK